ncbi:hypothetical protein [Flaviaesturariibacter amylovorans]|uniref:Phosphodiester glycosidase domain-containing protein n=1 Tax=Flaviaesturariibacter amylovorans TaxID=1084520 RepID=A0ABP8G7P8_9BACT
MRILLLALGLCLCGALQAQDFYGGKYRRKGYTHYGNTYTLYDFSREGTNMKAKYFAQNAYSQFNAWKSGKQILLITAGAFSDKWTSDAVPVGLCVDNGSIVNRSPHSDMDGMVIVYNGGSQQGGVAVVDMDYKNVTVQDPVGSSNSVSYAPRSSASDRVNFLNWGEKNGVTLFQTQLVYSSDRSSNFGNPTFGAKRERRFLSICRKGGVVHHVVVDAPDALELNLAASRTKEVLEHDGFSVLYILNLDTGCKNLLFAHNGSSLEDVSPKTSCTPAPSLENATNLIVYYVD